MQHLAGEGGGEHDRLAVRADVVDDAVDLRLEAHVEHAVRLVQHLRIANGMGILHTADMEQVSTACVDE